VDILAPPCTRTLVNQAMSDFPEIQGYEADTGFADKDLATRERELLGEDGAASLVGNGAAAAEHEDDGAPSADEGPAPEAAAASEDEGYASFMPSPAAPGAGPSAYVPKKANLAESEFLKDWKVKSELEIERRDKISHEKQEETREKAHTAIDDFYQNYNTKKEKEIEKVKEAAEAYIKKRDAEIGSGKGTTWDRIAELMDGLGRPAEGVEASDKKRFAELVQSLKGDANAPGAAGY